MKILAVLSAMCACLASIASFAAQVGPPSGPGLLTIDANYPAGIVFRLRSQVSDTLRVLGHVPRHFTPFRETDVGIINLWFAGMDGRYRITRSGGVVTVVRHANGHETRQRQKVQGTAEFDAFGYPKIGPSDPTDLIPIFPGHLVWVGQSWMATAPVEETLGSGTATYLYRVKRVNLRSDGHVLAVIPFTVRGTMLPPKALHGWHSELQGSGLLIWDCTAHQRASKRFQLTYTATHGQDALSERIADQETVYRAQ